jgi:flavin reductase (DIM6/NTAB) family NADH-FMN oxidoreductase RutF
MTARVSSIRAAKNKEGSDVDAPNQKDLHYYERANSHGLKHDPFNAIIAPRPIGWISSRDAKGNINLAPYSFFNGFCYSPALAAALAGRGSG